MTLERGGFARSCDKKNYLSFTTLPMVKETVVTYDEELPLIKVHNRSISWFCEVTW